MRDYLRGPWSLPGLGDADGVVNKVFPHLGIDCATIRDVDRLEGTFNVVDFVTKTCVAIPHTDVDDAAARRRHVAAGGDAAAATRGTGSGPTRCG